MIFREHKHARRTVRPSRPRNPAFLRSLTQLLLVMVDGKAASWNVRALPFVEFSRLQGSSCPCVAGRPISRAHLLLFGP
jgi:hypothetical protein